MTLAQSKTVAVDHVLSSVVSLPLERQIETLRAFAVISAHADVTALFFAAADELTSAQMRTEQLRLNFHQGKGN